MDKFSTMFAMVEGSESFMGTTKRSPLLRAFLSDHKQFMRLLRDVSAALDAGDVAKARELGQRLNQVAGPHIAFEEEVLYPSLAAASADRSFVPSLYAEHQDIVTALARLLSNEDLAGDTLSALKNDLRRGLEHARHCGTLISQLSTFEGLDQEEALASLNKLRSSGMTWLQLAEKEI